LGWKDIEIRKSEFVAKSQFFYQFIEFINLEFIKQFIKFINLEFIKQFIKFINFKFIKKLNLTEDTLIFKSLQPKHKGCRPKIFPTVRAKV